MSNIFTYKIARWAYVKQIPIIPRIFNKITRLIYSCEIPYTANIHSSVIFAHHGLGVVIGHDTVIGANCKILHNVTIGGRSGIRANPIIGKNVLVGAGAIILGDIKIGDNAKIGAGSIVIKDVPPGKVIVSESSKILTN